jgi:hypothetical protein
MKSWSMTKTYDNMLKLLKRNKVKKPGVIASIIFEKFVEAQYPTNAQKIPSDELKSKGVLTNTYNFDTWRTEMLNKGILICVATKQEIKETGANYKANMFKFGPSIKKYIESALTEQSSVFERLDTKASEKRVDEIEARLTKKMTELRFQLEDLILFVKPPVTEERRRIIRENQDNQEKCIRLLDLESEEENVKVA